MESFNRLFFTFLALFFATSLFGGNENLNTNSTQDSISPKKRFANWEFGFGAGLIAYQGDVEKAELNANFHQPKPIAMLNLRRNFGNTFALRGNFLYGKMAGDDARFDEPAWHKKRGISFESPLVEGSVQFEFYPLGIFRQSADRRKAQNWNDYGREDWRKTHPGTKGYDYRHFPLNDSTNVFDAVRDYRVRGNFDTVLTARKREFFAPYLFIGIGGGYTNPETDWNLTQAYAGGFRNPIAQPRLVALDRAEDVKRVNLIVPMGAGVRYGLNSRNTIGLEVGLRPTFSDYVDGVSQAGDPKNDDWYFIGMLTFSHNFGKLDADGDGILDKEDGCPSAPGTKSAHGCPDTDRDGILDSSDECPLEFGIASLGGCPDRDGDGVPDRSDACGDTPGSKTANGCPDADADGIADSQDECPNRPGTKENKGCPTPEMTVEQPKPAEPAKPAPPATDEDSDGDGIPNSKDACPLIKGVASRNGCPEPAPAPANSSVKNIQFLVVYFDTRKNDWNQQSYQTLNEAVRILNENPNVTARIEGHTDNTGTLAGNQKLGTQRAKNALEYLVSRGIARDRLSASGFADTRPVAENETPNGRQLNRRTEIHFDEKQ